MQPNNNAYRRSDVKTVRTLLRAIDEGDMTVVDMCGNDLSVERRQKVLKIVETAIRRGYVEWVEKSLALGSQPNEKRIDIERIPVKLTRAGSELIDKGLLPAKKSIDANTGISLDALKMVTEAIARQPTSIFKLASLGRMN